MTVSAYLLDIAYRPAPKAPMQTKNTTMVTRVAGVENDARRKPGKRQVTLLSEEQWHQACEQLNTQLPWTIRRANFLIRGVQFDSEFIGKQIKIGQLILQVTGETDPCYKMDIQFAGLMSALTPHWRGGVCCKVIADGRVSVGDVLHVI